MLLLIFGSREITSEQCLFEALDAWGREDEVTSVMGGGADGADKLGYIWAGAKGLPYEMYEAKWHDIPPGTPERKVGYSRVNGKYLKAAGHIRNAKMRDRLIQALEEDGNAFALGLMLVGGTRGSEGMAKILHEAGIEPFIMEFTEEEAKRVWKPPHQAVVFEELYGKD